ncbi:Kelch domain-containing protein 3, partial [Trichinella pseudospiralis]
LIMFLFLKGLFAKHRWSCSFSVLIHFVVCVCCFLHLMFQISDLFSCALIVVTFVMHWTFSIENGPRRVNHAAVAYNNYIFSFGGHSAEEVQVVYEKIDIHVFCPTAFKWKEMPMPDYSNIYNHWAPCHRYGHTAVTYKDKCYIFGGRNIKVGACLGVFQFDFKTRVWHKKATLGYKVYPRDAHTCCVYGSMMIIFGGFVEYTQQFSNDVFILDLDTFIWRKPNVTGTPPIWRDFHTATVIGDRMYVFGGRSDEAAPYHSNVERYPTDLFYLDLSTFTWHEVQTTGERPTGRRSHSAWEHSGCLYIFGGYNGLTNHHSNSVYRFNPNSSKWEKLKPGGCPPTPRRRQCCVKIGSKVYIFGGTSPQFPVSHYYRIVGPNELYDLSDLYILDMNPTLETLCMESLLNRKAVIKKSEIPKILWKKYQAILIGKDVSNSHGNRQRM